MEERSRAAPLSGRDGEASRNAACAGRPACIFPIGTEEDPVGGAGPEGSSAPVPDGSPDDCSVALSTTLLNEFSAWPVGSCVAFGSDVVLPDVVFPDVAPPEVPFPKVLLPKPPDPDGTESSADACSPMPRFKDDRPFVPKDCWAAWSPDSVPPGVPAESRVLSRHGESDGPQMPVPPTPPLRTRAHHQRSAHQPM